MTRSLSAARPGAGNSHPIPLGPRRMAALRQQALVMLLALAAILIGVSLSTLFFLVVRS
ncbi:hypothetical protein [Castellaniella sp.]|uniref:hypothetical protein n=1 Tax=Castellaniella sp. TaxID=1955812 RepID=UPI002AFFA9AF|nr:hypothetical protein [Castellaniella sp.]